MWYNACLSALQLLDCHSSCLSLELYLSAFVSNRTVALTLTTMAALRRVLLLVILLTCFSALLGLFDVRSFFVRHTALPGSSAERHRRRHANLSGPAIVHGKEVKIKKLAQTRGKTDTSNKSTKYEDAARERARVLAEEGLPPIYRYASSGFPRPLCGY